MDCGLRIGDFTLVEALPLFRLVLIDLDIHFVQVHDWILEQLCLVTITIEPEG